MEYLHPHLLSTKEVMRILNEREIDIPGMDTLSRYELLQIFNKFALPLSQRRSEKSAPSPQIQGDLMTDEEKFLHKRILPPLENECISKIARISLTVNVNGTKQKRYGEDEAVVNPPKRKKITWP